MRSPACIKNVYDLFELHEFRPSVRFSKFTYIFIANDEIRNWNTIDATDRAVRRLLFAGSRFLVSCIDFDQNELWLGKIHDWNPKWRNIVHFWTYCVLEAANAITRRFNRVLRATGPAKCLCTITVIYRFEYINKYGVWKKIQTLTQVNRDYLWPNVEALTCFIVDAQFPLILTI